MAQSIRALPHQVRPREKLLRSGPAGLALHELISIILITGTHTQPVTLLAKRVAKLLQRWNTITQADLVSKGCGQSKSAQIMALVEIVRRLKYPVTQQFDRPEVVYAHAYELTRDDKEKLMCLYLNARGELLKKEIIALGTLNAVKLLPRELFHPIKELPVASIILAHNHPSEVCSPSPEDIVFTERVRQAADILGVTLLDHLIVTKDGWVQVPQ